MGLICTCQGCGMKLGALRAAVIWTAAFFAFLHGAFLFGRIMGSSDEGTAAAKGNMATLTGGSYNDTDNAAEDDDPADTAMRIVTNLVAFIGNLCGLFGARTYTSGGSSSAFKAYMAYLTANCLWTAGYTMYAVMDIERYCETTQEDDADCEDDSAQTGVLVLVIYQSTQLLGYVVSLCFSSQLSNPNPWCLSARCSLWAAWSLYVAVRDPGSTVAPIQPYVQPMQPQAYAMPMQVAQPMASTAMHGNEMAEHAGKSSGGGGKHHRDGGGKHRKEGKRSKGGGGEGGGEEYEPSSWARPQSGGASRGKSKHKHPTGGAEGSRSGGAGGSKPRKIIPIFEAP